MPGLTEPNQVGKREDLADMMVNIDQRSTPFTTAVNKSKKPTNSEFDWQVDNYANPKVTGTVDGEDVTAFENHAENRARLGNYVQIFRRSAKVSRLAENLSNVAGVRSEIAQAAAKKLVEVKRDQEATFLGDNDGRADNGAVGYLTCGLDVWISTAGPTAPRSVPAPFRTPTNQVDTTATASLTEEGTAAGSVQFMLKEIWETTGMNGNFVIFCGAVLRRRFTDMTRTVTASTGGTNTQTNLRVRNFNQATTDRRVVNTTTVYEGDFGVLTLVPSNFIGGATYDDDRGYVLDMNKIHLRSLSTPSVERFDDQGGGPRLLVEAVCGLQVDSPLGLGKFKP